MSKRKRHLTNAGTGADTLLRLVAWYRAQCNGEWEHGRGIRIESLDNPGWLLKIDLTRTRLQDEPFERQSRGLIEGSAIDDNWWTCSVTDEKLFTAACGPRYLDQCLRIFLDWAESKESK